MTGKLKKAYINCGRTCSSSVASSGMQFDGTSTTHRHFMTLCLSVYVSTLVYPVPVGLYDQ